jgi:hypothetical protein
MVRIIYAFLFSLLVQQLAAQLGAGPVHTWNTSGGISWLNSGDQLGAGGQIEYTYTGKRGWTVAAGINASYSSGEGFYTREPNATVITRYNTSPFFQSINEQLVQEGWIVNDPKTTKSFYRMAFISGGYSYLIKTKHQLQLVVGGVFALVDKTYQSEAIQGDFEALGESQPITLVIPLHVNFYDYGFLGSARYTYWINNRLGISANAMGYVLSESGDGIFQGNVGISVALSD